MRIRNLLAKRLPALGRLKRFLWAAGDAIVPRSSYSQHREDVLFHDLFNASGASYEIDYIDVGANHPTSISNTYLLYRRGFSGYLIEPNPELIRLCRLFRPRDISLQMGIAKNASLLQLKISATPTISSFSDSHLIRRKQTLFGSECVPVMSLDDAFSCIEGRIGLLSIDVEGMNLEVLLSGLAVARRAHYLCVEHDDETEAGKIAVALSEIGFSPVGIYGCNQVFENQLFLCCGAVEGTPPLPRG